MFRILALVSTLLFSAVPAGAQVIDYLNDPQRFAAGWEKLTAEMGSNIDLSEVVIRPNEITAQARSTQGGARIDSWRLGQARLLLLTIVAVTGPRPMQPSGPVGDIESGFFPLASIPIDRLPEIVSAAIASVRLQDPGRAAYVRIARDISVIPRPGYGEVRWSISLGNGRESASVTAAADGRIIGADISQTDRGRRLDFLTQSDWPFAEAQATFRNLIGTAPLVYEITARDKAITVRAAPPDTPQALASWTWNGGSYSRSGLVMTNIALMSNAADLPYSLEEVDLAQFPKVMAAARAAAGRAGNVQSVSAIKPHVATGVPAVQWVVKFGAAWSIATAGTALERTVVRVTPDGAVISVLLPESQRPKVDRLGGAAIAEAIARMRAEFGDDTQVFQLDFRDDRANAKGKSPTNERMTLEVRLTDEGFKLGSEFPIMMETDADLFALSTLEGLDAATIDAIKASAVAAIDMAGAEVHRIRIWGGSPFWRPRDGRPLMDVRVGVPPRYDAGGYVVFTLGGKLVETMK